MLFTNDVEGKRQAKYLSAIIYCIPIILFWSFFIYNFLSSANNQCFPFISILAFFLIPSFAMIAYVKSGDQISLNSFRTMGYLMISSWLSLLLSFLIALFILYFNENQTLRELYQYLLSSEKIVNFVAESIFFSIFTFCGAVFIIYSLKNTIFNKRKR